MEPELLGADVGLDEATEVLERTGRPFTPGGGTLPSWLGRRLRHHARLDADSRRVAAAAFWIAAGMSGHGFKLSPAVGEMMAALITGATPPVDPAPFAFGRFDAKGPSGTFVASYLS
jgi:hypothetical protein